MIFLMFYDRTWLSAWDDASPADRFRIVVDKLAALLSASILKKFSQPLAQMAPSTKSKLENLVKVQKDLAEAVTNAYLSTEFVEVTDEVAAMFPAHLQTSLPEHQRAKKVLILIRRLLLICGCLIYEVSNFCSLRRKMVTTLLYKS